MVVVRNPQRLTLFFGGNGGRIAVRERALAVGEALFGAVVVSDFDNDAFVDIVAAGTAPCPAADQETCPALIQFRHRFRTPHANVLVEGSEDGDVTVIDPRHPARYRLDVRPVRNQAAIRVCIVPGKMIPLPRAAAGDGRTLVPVTDPVTLRRESTRLEDAAILTLKLRDASVADAAPLRVFHRGPHGEVTELTPEDLERVDDFLEAGGAGVRFSIRHFGTYLVVTERKTLCRKESVLLHLQRLNEGVNMNSTRNTARTLSKSLVLVVVLLSDLVSAQTVWTKHPDNPVLVPGPPGSWDSPDIHGHAVIFDETDRSAGPDGTYRMWYNGGSSPFTGNGFHVGYATSADGIRWDKHANPVLARGPPRAWDGGSVFMGASVILDDRQGRAETRFKMWYGGLSTLGKEEIGFATSRDGVNWIKWPENPVYDTDAGRAYHEPSVVLVGDEFHMFFVGGNNEDAYIVHAVSRNGVDWTPLGTVLSGRPMFWDTPGVYTPNVIYDQAAQLYRMWYSGGGFGKVRIGYATSADAVRRVFPLDIFGLLIEGRQRSQYGARLSLAASLAQPDGIALPLRSQSAP